MATGIVFINAFPALVEQGVFQAMHQHFADDADMEHILIDSTIVRATSTHAEELYRAIVGNNQVTDVDDPVYDIASTGFDPTRLRALEWQQILEKVAANLSVEELSSRRSKKKMASQENQEDSNKKNRNSEK